MTLPSGIVWRNRTAYVRCRVPPDVQEAFGRSIVRESLNTQDERTAVRLGLARLAALAEEWEDIRRRRSITPEDHRRIAAGFYVEQLEADRKRRAGYATALEIEAAGAKIADAQAVIDGTTDDQLAYLEAVIKPEEDASTRAELIAALRSGLRTGEPYTIKRAVREIETRADAAIRADKLLVAKGSTEYRELCQTLQRAWLQVLERQIERDAGRWDGAPKDKIVIPPKSSAVDTAAPGETILELFDNFATENPEGVKADTLAQSRMAVELFVDHVGTHFPASSIGKPEVRTWKALLLKFPVKARETKVFAGMSLKDTVATNAALPDEERKPTISPKTVNRYLAGLSAFIEWLVPSGYLKENPLNGMFIRIDKTKGTKPVFSADEMQTLFSSPLFAGCQSDEKLALMAQPGNFQIRDHRYWLPLVMLWSGARPAEIAQLLVADVREQHGQWIMHITEEGDDDKSTKTKGSMRVVPIHSELVRLGFVNFVKAQLEKGEKRIFPEAERNSRGQMAAKFSRDFGRYLEKVGIKDGRGLSLYSFRHGAADALRRAEYLDEEFAMILGHAKHTTTGRYGHLPEGMLRQRVELVEAIAYRGLDLQHLYPPKLKSF